MAQFERMSAIKSLGENVVSVFFLDDTQYIYRFTRSLKCIDTRRDMHALENPIYLLLLKKKNIEPVLSLKLIISMLKWLNFLHRLSSFP